MTFFVHVSKVCLDILELFSTVVQQGVGVLPKIQFFIRFHSVLIALVIIIIMLIRFQLLPTILKYGIDLKYSNFFALIKLLN